MHKNSKLIKITKSSDLSSEQKNKTERLIRRVMGGYEEAGTTSWASSLLILREG